ncbi:type VI secretion system transmembrane protein TssO [Cellulophaga sp. E16_2]|uniref:type VI secretion system TssO n=1 Tax=unclassified Cellulophaga TaxID=2634405 RepID=UPI0013FD77F7|nr:MULTISPECIES: type VI secretion system TssO [unclassified Cellulophaga]MBO0593381.1 type VI secretion system transmembrane protein TssO [Cellulophaga sp. E16_2]
MEILNKKERISAFLLFLLMFLVTIILLFVAVFFSYKLPWKENEVLRAENKKIQYEFMYQKQFIKELKRIDVLIDSLDKTKQGNIFLERSINTDLVHIKDDIPTDSLENRNMYENLILTYKKLLDAKRDLKQVSNAKAEIEKLDSQLDDYEDQIRNLETALELARRINRNQ